MFIIVFVVEFLINLFLFSIGSLFINYFFIDIFTIEIIVLLSVFWAIVNTLFNRYGTKNKIKKILGDSND